MQGSRQLANLQVSCPLLSDPGIREATFWWLHCLKGGGSQWLQRNRGNRKVGAHGPPRGVLVPDHWMSLKKRKQSHVRNRDFVLDTKVKDKLFCQGL